jgi:lipopolysaccharide/colanic/teichoic acid biosynthesis glycosyltransferase
MPHTVSSPPIPYPRPKQFVDKLVAAGLLLVMSPVLVFVLVAIAIDMLLSRRDRGSFLYRESRISKGRPFDLLKFRTVRRTASESQAGGEAHARLLEADPANLTWAGRRIVKPWYLDELPQLVNVLKGDMSLVGPRPWPPSMARQQVAEGLDYRNLITAGLTGLAQIQKDVVEPTRYAELDLVYVDACRTLSGAQLVRYDLGILWKTAKLIARGEGLRF